MPSLRSILAVGSIAFIVWSLGSSVLQAGPYALSLNDPTNTYDAPIAGFLGPDGEGKARIEFYDIDTKQITISNPNNYVNPLFQAWVNQVIDYSPAPNVYSQWQDTDCVIGAVTGVLKDIVSLGDLDATQIANKVAPGSITLGFAVSISNGTGADFAVFENAFISAGVVGVAGQTFAELAYVEVSTDGIYFARFPSRSLTSGTVGPNGTIDPTNVYNLAGKSINNDGDCWGTPFDLDSLKNHPMVLGGLVNLQEINYVRIIAVVGDGTSLDDTGAPIYTPWCTTLDGSGGFDLEAVGAIHVMAPAPNLSAWRQQYFGNTANVGSAADTAAPRGDGVPNLIKFATGQDPTVSGKMPGTATLSGSNLIFTYPRNKTAVGEITFTVEWSDDLKTWSSLNVVESNVVDNGATESVSVTIPKDTSTHRFVRLKVGR